MAGRIEAARNDVESLGVTRNGGARASCTLSAFHSRAFTTPAPLAGTVF